MHSCAPQAPRVSGEEVSGEVRTGPPLMPPLMPAQQESRFSRSTAAHPSLWSRRTTRTVHWELCGRSGGALGGEGAASGSRGTQGTTQPSGASTVCFSRTGVQIRMSQASSSYAAGRAGPSVGGAEARTHTAAKADLSLTAPPLSQSAPLRVPPLQRRGIPATGRTEETGEDLCQTSCSPHGRRPVRLSCLTSTAFCE